MADDPIKDLHERVGQASARAVASVVRWEHNDGMSVGLDRDDNPKVYMPTTAWEKLVVAAVDSSASADH